MYKQQGVSVFGWAQFGGVPDLTGGSDLAGGFGIWGVQGSPGARRVEWNSRLEGLGIGLTAWNLDELASLGVLCSVSDSPFGSSQQTLLQNDPNSTCFNNWSNGGYTL
jgi:hypothetical protein